MNNLYCGTEDNVEFFKEVLKFIGVEDVLKYRVIVVDGEYEIEAFFE